MRLADDGPILSTKERSYVLGPGALVPFTAVYVSAVAAPGARRKRTEDRRQIPRFMRLRLTTTPTRREASPPAAEAAVLVERLRAGDAHELHPLLQRQSPVDQPGERGDDRRLEPGALDRAGQQRHGLEGLDRLADPAGDLLGRDALGQQLAGAAVARLWRKRGGHQVARARATDERARAR